MVAVHTDSVGQEMFARVTLDGVEATARTDNALKDFRGLLPHSRNCKTTEKLKVLF